jgi:hypothetical protein
MSYSHEHNKINWKGKFNEVQGGAVNRGLFFAGLLPSPLWAVSEKIRENRWAAA